MRNKAVFFVGYALVAGSLLAAGCSTSGARTGVLPPVHYPDEAGRLTLYRDGSLVGAIARIVVSIDGREVYRVARNESFDLPLDPGQYLIDYRIGVNECRRLVLIKPRQHQRLRLVPNCSVFGDLN